MATGPVSWRVLGGGEVPLNRADAVNINGWPVKQNLVNRQKKKKSLQQHVNTHRVPSTTTGVSSGRVLTTGVAEQDRAGLLAALSWLDEHTEIRPSVPKQEIGCIFPSKTH